MTDEELKEYLKTNLRIEGSFSDSDCFGKSIMLSLYLNEDEISTCSIHID